jgi:hypothetical protein
MPQYAQVAEIPVPIQSLFPQLYSTAKKPPLQHHAQDSLPADPELVNLNLSTRVGTTGIVQLAHTISAEELQLDTLYWPIAHTEQSVQTLAPLKAYFPAGQAVHALTEPTPKVPAGHAVQLAAPASENVPLVHRAQEEAPRMLAGKLYLPASHASHVLLRPNMVENVPSAQSSQSTSEVFEHALHPGMRLYLPAEHRMHGPPARKTVRLLCIKCHPTPSAKLCRRHAAPEREHCKCQVRVAALCPAL